MIAPKCFIGIPYSSSGDIYREKAFQMVYNYYKQLGYNIFIGESEEPFNRAAARNACVPKFIDWDIVVFIDADIIVPLEQIEQAIRLAHNIQEMVVAYRDLFLLDKDQSNWFYETEEIPGTWKKKVQNQVSGAFVVPKKIWNQVGGQDERFKEWGGEDRAFYYSCASCYEKVENTRIAGHAFHLWHERKEKETFQFLSYNPLLNKYRNVLGLSEKFKTHKNKTNFKTIEPILKSEK